MIQFRKPAVITYFAVLVLIVCLLIGNMDFYANAKATESKDGKENYLIEKTSFANSATTPYLNQETDSKAATVIVAASNSKNTSDADFKCDGTDDDVQIQAAINALPDAGGRAVRMCIEK